MVEPKNAFDNPASHLTYFTSREFEDQHFERKEFPNLTQSSFSKFKEQLIEAVSAFANANRNGGLIVLGISDEGIVKGNSIGEEKIREILHSIAQSLKNQATQVSDFQVSNERGEPDKIILIYVPYIPHAICETNEAVPKAWRRSSKQNLPLSEADREQLKRDKQIVSFERTICCPYNQDEIDLELAEEFKKYFLESRDGRFNHTLENVFISAGVVFQEEGKYYITNGGYLVFGKNPTARTPGAFVRFLRYDLNIADRDTRAPTSFDKGFYGPIPILIGQIKTWLKSAAFFKTYTKRVADGNFVNEPEYPPTVIDEAIVNAIVHREYALSVPILCIAYKDAFVVVNPGRILQDVPPQFNLSDTRLISMPRNPKIAEWMRIIKDEDGKFYVRSLSEGTRIMLEEMEKAGLPAPSYTTNGNTVVTLYNELPKREAAISIESYKGLRLKEEQKKAIEYLIKNGTINNANYREINSVTPIQATTDLRGLVEKGVIERVGPGRKDALYRLKTP